MDDQTAQYYDQLRRDFEAQLGEPVLAVSVFNTSGGMASMAVRKVSPIVAWGMRKRAASKAGGLPKRTALAITASEVHAYALEFKGRSEHLASEAGRWPRAAVRLVGSQNNTVYRRVTLDLSGIEAILDGGKDDSTSRFFDLLATRAPAA